MKIKFPPKVFVTSVGIMALTLSVMPVAAENPSSTSATAASQSAPPLTSGVPDVLKMAQAKVSDDTIVSYIHNSNTSYVGLSASEIVYLHDQGVSDRVVTAMLNQRQNLNKATAKWVAQQTAAAPAPTPQATPPPANPVQYPGQNAGSTVTYVQTPPTSTVYIMQDSSRGFVDYGYYPSYGYSGWWYPPVSFSFGFGGRFHEGGFHGGGFHGGFHGGGHHR